MSKDSDYKSIWNKKLEEYEEGEIPIINYDSLEKIINSNAVTNFNLIIGLFLTLGLGAIFIISDRAKDIRGDDEITFLIVFLLCNFLIYFVSLLFVFKKYKEKGEFLNNEDLEIFNKYPNAKYELNTFLNVFPSTRSGLNKLIYKSSVLDVLLIYLVGMIAYHYRIEELFEKHALVLVRNNTLFIPVVVFFHFLSLYLSKKINYLFFKDWCHKQIKITSEKQHANSSLTHKKK